MERKEIYPENLYFDPTAGKVSEGMKTRIGIYYKCIPPIGEETTSQVIVTPPKEKLQFHRKKRKISESAGDD